MQITLIEPQKKRKDRYNIYIDGEFRFGLDEGVVARFGLYEKKEISEKEIEQIEKEEVVAKAFNAAANFLRARERSEKEIRNKLRTKEYSENIIEKVLEKLKELNLVDDKRFAEMFVRDRMKLKPKGKKSLEIELKQKGIDNKIILEVLDHLINSESEKELLERVLEKAKKKYGDLSVLENKQKIVRYLISRGFSYDLINSNLEK